MRKFLIPLFLIVAGQAIGQQSFSSNFINDVQGRYRSETFMSFKDSILNAKDSKLTNTAIQKIRQEKRLQEKKYRRTIELNLPVFGIYGIGNINQESLNSLNAAGKISLYGRPVQFRNNAITVYASYNKAASNNDSVIFEKLIFPEIGKSSFTGTVQFDKFWKRDSTTGHALGSFFEFAVKKIQSDSSVENQKLYFTALAYTLGFKYTYGFSKKSDNDPSKTTDLSFFATPYISVLNVPNEDTADYRSLVIRNSKFQPTTKPLTDKIVTAGIKIGFQINNLQVFADLRSVINKRENVPVRALQGFHSNIGIAFNAEVFEFRR